MNYKKYNYSYALLLVLTIICLNLNTQKTFATEETKVEHIVVANEDASSNTYNENVENFDANLEHNYIDENDSSLTKNTKELKSNHDSQTQSIEKSLVLDEPSHSNSLIANEINEDDYNSDLYIELSPFAYSISVESLYPTEAKFFTNQLLVSLQKDLTENGFKVSIVKDYNQKTIAIKTKLPKTNKTSKPNNTIANSENVSEDVYGIEKQPVDSNLSNSSIISLNEDSNGNQESFSKNSNAPEASNANSLAKTIKGSFDSISISPLKVAKVYGSTKMSVNATITVSYVYANKQSTYLSKTIASTGKSNQDYSENLQDQENLAKKAIEKAIHQVSQAIVEQLLEVEPKENTEAGLSSGNAKESGSNNLPLNNQPKDRLIYQTSPGKQLRP